MLANIEQNRLERLDKQGNIRQTKVVAKIHGLSKWRMKSVLLADQITVIEKYIMCLNINIWVSENLNCIYYIF